MNDCPYQVMPDPTPVQIEELRASIRDVGVLKPILVDRAGNIIDGHWRKKLADELGVPCPVETISDELTEEMKVDLAIRLNWHRRHTDTPEARAHTAHVLRTQHGYTLKQAAAAMGMSVTGVRKALQRAEAELLSEADPEQEGDPNCTESNSGQPDPEPEPEPEPESEPEPATVKTIKAAMELTGCSRKSIKQAVEDGELPERPWTERQLQDWSNAREAASVTSETGVSRPATYKKRQAKPDRPEPDGPGVASARSCRDALHALQRAIDKNLTDCGYAADAEERTAIRDGLQAVYSRWIECLPEGTAERLL